jgi:TPR repeat protein
MQSFTRRFSFSLLIIPLLASLPAGADLETAKRAYQTKNYAAAFKEATSLAEQGNAEAQVLLGRMYLKGDGALADSDQAIKWFKASATQGNADAQFFLGSMYLLSQKDVGEGVKWLLLSAEQGNQDAQYLLGKTYIQGRAFHAIRFKRKCGCGSLLRTTLHSIRVNLPARRGK